jgi:hypothetical protein
VSKSAATLEWLLPASDIDTDRKVLAGLLLELARNVDANVGAESTGITPFDPRLEQLRALLLGREIELSRHFSQVRTIPSSWRSLSVAFFPPQLPRPRHAMTASARCWHLLWAARSGGIPARSSTSSIR